MSCSAAHRVSGQMPMEYLGLHNIGKVHHTHPFEFTVLGSFIVCLSRLNQVTIHGPSKILKHVPNVIVKALRYVFFQEVANDLGKPDALKDICRFEAK